MVGRTHEWWQRTEHFVRRQMLWGNVYRVVSYTKSALWVVPFAAILLVLMVAPALRVLDVRTPQENASHRLPNATLVPVQELDRRHHELDKSASWVVYCEHGRRSLFACEILAQAGFTKLANLRGGIAHWASCGLPFEQGRKR